jgi:hypothetical protein
MLYTYAICYIYQDWLFIVLLQNVKCWLKMSSMHAKCHMSAKSQACMQNVTWVQKVKHACKMLSINAKCQTWVQNVEHKCKMSNMSAECQSWLENVEHECKMLNVCKISYISAKCQACLQNVEHKCKMSKMSAKCQR